jgi:hypothetical protein
LLIGVGVLGKHHPLGILIDNRNKYSLSRLQIVLWTWVLVSAFFAIMLVEKTVSIYLPPEIWALMGITTASAAAAVMIKDVKAQQEPTDEQKAKQQSAAAAPDSDVAEPLGVLATAKKPRLANFFSGDELADDGWVDISKVQMFFFTLAAIAGYVWALWNAENLRAGPAEVAADYELFFPALSASLVTLIGISHAGYLTVKASPKTPTKN